MQGLRVAVDAASPRNLRRCQGTGKVRGAFGSARNRARHVVGLDDGFFSLHRNACRVQDIDAVVGDAEQESLSQGVDHHYRSFLPDALAAKHCNVPGSPAPSRTLAKPALQNPHQTQHCSQGHEDAQPEDQGFHLAMSVRDVQDPGDPDRVVLVDNNNFTVGDEASVQQDVHRCTRGAV